MAQHGASSLPLDAWLADSAASKHILKDKSFFQSYSAAGNHSVTGFGSVPCHGTGNAAVASHVKTSAYNIALRDSLHVPDAPFNYWTHH
ncbi:hypothetical protein DFH08DRAFT_715830 [Mycena albidolilacea]|uniref:Retrovirus-related Pol polyprotein from transposon TNT 1-94-like beta-barrel domain-containing protein n=1 Tax=Mycena albidolilacea TaxID=1033008 RepID=A0AAD6ZBB5_9AGAR|nr:hypothetical protein DFH08DRAFT_715830 [Mycena albidolilacea]